MRYLKSYNTRARSALLGERNTLRKQDIEVDGRRFNDTHPVKCSFSLKMRFLSEVRTLIAMGIYLLCVLLGFHSLHQRFCKASRSFFFIAYEKSRLLQNAVSFLLSPEFPNIRV